MKTIKVNNTLLGIGTFNEYWNLNIFQFNGITVEQCCKYLDFYLPEFTKQFSTEKEVIGFIDSIRS